MIAIYIELLKRYYDPHDYIFKRFKKVHRLAQRMLRNNYTPLEVVQCCNTARAHWNLDLLPCPKEKE